MKIWKNHFRLLAIALLLVTTSFITLANTATYFNEEIALLSTNCFSTGVNMVDGKVTNTATPNLNMICSPNKKGKANLHCVFLDSTGKTYSEDDYSAAIVGENAYISDENKFDTIFINLVTQKFVSDSRLNFDNGKTRGLKICGGSFFYQKDIKKKQKIVFGF